MNKENRTAVICPYYKGESRNGIRCESPIRAQNVHILMKGPRHLAAYKETVCGSFYYAQRCAIARLNEEKYE